MLRLTDFHAGDAGDYSVSVSNHLGLATIPSAKLSVNFVAVQAALDNGLPWSNEVSSQGWFAQTNETHDGVDGAQNGSITHNQFSWLDSSVVGPGTLTFWCKVSSAGPHTLRWRYVKDISDTFGQDAGWLDEVHFTPPVVPPQFGGGLSASNGTFALRLTGSPGTGVVVERSFDLLTWTPLQTNALPAGGLDQALPMTTNPQQFFRARIPEP